MKIAYIGLRLPEGKIKHNDSIFTDLVEKFEPTKVSPYYFEFIPDAFDSAEIIAIANEKVLDLLVLDMEKIEARLQRAEEPTEIRVLEKCLAHLEDLKPICDLSLDDNERAVVTELGLVSYKPTLIYHDIAPESDIVCRDGMEKGGKMFFYTVGKQEVHAWMVERETDAASCAGKIHSDLARGFIKAEIVKCDDMMTVHNMQDARAKKLTKLVDRDHPIPVNSILDIHFNV